MADAPAGVKVKLWDGPVRLVHWLLVALIGFSWWASEDHLNWHRWSGYAIIGLLVFRIWWGFAGGEAARFSSFVKGPRAIAGYLRTVGRRDVAVTPGHNPLGALSVIAILLALIAQVGLGLFAMDDDGLYEGPLAFLISIDAAEEIADLHEDLFEVIKILVGLHIAAILFYRLVLGKRLVGPMITGKAPAEAGVEPMRAGRWWAALLCLVAAIAITRWIIAGAPLP